MSGYKQCCDCHLKQSYRITQRACGTVTRIKCCHSKWSTQDWEPSRRARSSFSSVKQRHRGNNGSLWPLNQSFLGRKEKLQEILRPHKIGIFFYYLFFISTNTLTNTGVHGLALVNTHTEEIQTSVGSQEPSITFPYSNDLGLPKGNTLASLEASIDAHSQWNT